MEIILTKNNGYKWISNNNTYFKGYMVYNETLFKDKDALNLLDSIKTIKDFKKFIESIDGQFAFITTIKNSYVAAVDIARSLPLYFNTDGTYISDDSTILSKELNLTSQNVNTDNLIELFMTGFISGNETTYTNIKTLDLGQYLIVSNNKVNVKYYYRHINKKIITKNNNIDERFINVSNKMINNLVKAVNGRQIILSLSGGYDSRYIACLLKENNIENVKCYTYGKRNSFEIQESQKVAKNLGYEWINIEYSDEKIRNLINEDEFINYCDNNNYIIYLQNYLAVKELIKINYCDKDAVFVTGLCADMPSGYYVNNLSDSKNYESELIDNLYNYYFTKRKLKKNKEDLFKRKIKQEIRSLDIKCNNRDNYIKISDCISTGYDHSRRFLNMNAAHEFWGHEFILPCWNKDFLNFWYTLPKEYRYKQNYYESFLMNYLFNKYNVDDKKIIASHGSNKIIVKAKYFIGGIAAFILYHLHIPLKRHVDINNFALLELEYFKKIKNKKLIKYKRASLAQLSTIYFLEKRYGYKKVAELKKYIK